MSDRYPFDRVEKDRMNHKNNGYDVVCTHNSQKARYGDTYREFIVKSDKPQEEVLVYCNESVYACKLTSEEYLKDERAGVKDFGDHFRSNFKFRKVSDGEYFYQVIQPSTH